MFTDIRCGNGYKVCSPIYRVGTNIMCFHMCTVLSVIYGVYDVLTDIDEFKVYEVLTDIRYFHGKTVCSRIYGV